MILHFAWRQKFSATTWWRYDHLKYSMKFYGKKVKIYALKKLLGATSDVLVLSTYRSSNNPMLVNSQGKFRLESELS